jgi:hypothetical protein
MVVAAALKKRGHEVVAVETVAGRGKHFNKTTSRVDLRLADA